MKAYVLDAVNELNLRDVELRQLNPGEALVEIEAAGICESDIPRIFTTGTYHFPTIPGHEFAGRVVDVYGMEDGLEEDQKWVGKRVGVFPLIPCKECKSCSKHQYEMCEHYSYLGSRTDGGFAEYVIVPLWNLIELPEAVSFEEAAMLEPAAVALHAVRRAGIDPFTTTPKLRVLILGLGTVAGIVAQWLAIAGVEDVVATCHYDEHGKLMQQVACADYKYANTRNVEHESGLLMNDYFDIVIDCVNSSSTVSTALRCVIPGGQILIVGNPHGDLSLDKNSYWKILRKQVRLTGTWNSTFDHDERDDWHGVIDAVSSGKLRLKPMITHQFSFDGLKEGLKIKKEKSDYVNKVMICR